MDNRDIKCRIIEEELKTFWGQWHVDRWLGGGSFGDVFQISRDDYGIRRVSALKVIQVRESMETVPLSPVTPSAGGNASIPEALRNEIQIMETLRGAPNIVSIEDFFYKRNATTSSLFVRMEYLTSFEEVLKSRQTHNTLFSIPEILKIGRDICTALMYCESKGIIHRDIKPANLFLDEFGNYKVGDFGVSKRMDTVHLAHTMTGIGTISYMAPEIFGGRNYNNTVDIYALGLVLYQLLNNGRTPFLPTKGPYTASEVDSANYRRLRGEPVPSLTGSSVGDGTVDAQLDAIVRKACAPMSVDRYRTAKEFYDALAAWGTQTQTGAQQSRKTPQQVGTSFGDKDNESPLQHSGRNQRATYGDEAKSPSRERQAAEKAAKKPKKTVSIILPIIVACIAFLIVLSKAINQGNSNTAKAEQGQESAENNTVEEKNEQESAENNTAEEENEQESTYDTHSVQESVDDIHALNVGDVYNFGSYEQDNNTENGTEDIEWLVLAKEDDRILVISKYALDCPSYSSSGTDVTWETCSLREWLNETFLNTAFSEDERAMIPSVTVSADKNPSYDTSPGNSTTDQVFLLSIKEANTYFSSDDDRRCEGTAYCYAQGAYKADNGNCLWWLRSPGFDSNYAAFVSVGGSAFDLGSYVGSDDCAVRPALWINLGSGIF